MGGLGRIAAKSGALTAVIVAAGIVAGSGANGALATVDVNRVKHVQGVYAMPAGTELAVASAGNEAVVGLASQLSKSAALLGLRAVDTQPQKSLYAAMCPRGAGSCAPLTATARSKLMSTVKAKALEAKRRGGLAAYYLVDDNWTNFGAELGSVYAAIRSVDSSTPTMCALWLPLVRRSASATTVASAITEFKAGLRNYSPKWCNSVAIYAYAPTAGTPTILASDVEWDMRRTMPSVITALRERGWTDAAPLIGIPQSFGYWPRTSRAGQPVAPTYRPMPSTLDLTAQVRAFCAVGADSILGYAWDDGSGGKIYNLRNSASLRSGIRQGVQECRSRFW